MGLPGPGSRWEERGFAHHEQVAIYEDYKITIVYTCLCKLQHIPQCLLD